MTIADVPSGLQVVVVEGLLGGAALPSQRRQEEQRLGLQPAVRRGGLAKKRDGELRMGFEDL